MTKGLREVAENRLKYPNMPVKESMLKLFSLFLKAENPANTEYMSKKYHGKMAEFVEKCELAEDISVLSEEKSKGQWSDFKEKYYHELGAKYDAVLKSSEKDRADGFKHFIK